MTHHRASYTITTIAVTALAFTCLVQGGAAAQNWKIGVVDMDGVREGHTWLKQEYEKLQKIVESLESELKPLQDKIDSETKAYEANKASLSNTERFTKENEIKSLSLAYQNGWKERQLQIDEKEIEVNKEAFADIQSVIEAIAAEEGYHLILRAQEERSQVLFFSTTIDITSKVVDRLNKLKK